MSAPRVRPDVLVQDHGSIILVQPETKVALCWLLNHTQHDAQWFGGALAVEPRYLSDLLTGMSEGGFVVEAAR